MGLISGQPIPPQSPSDVFIFYNSDDYEAIAYIRANLRSIRKDYPKYSYHFYERSREYNDVTLDWLVKSEIYAARLLPTKEESIDKPIFAVEQSCTKISWESFRNFMNELVLINTKRILDLGYENGTTIDEASKLRFLNLSYGKGYKSPDTVFTPKVIRLSNNSKITLKIEDLYGDNYDKSTVQGRWVPKLYIDDTECIVQPTTHRERQVMFFFLLINRNKEFKYSEFRRYKDPDKHNAHEDKIRAIIKSLYPNLIAQNAETTIGNINHILKKFDEASSNKLIGSAKQIKVKDGNESSAVLPYSWIKMRYDSNNGKIGTAAFWSFSPPEKIEIDTRDFEEAMKKYM